MANGIPETWVECTFEHLLKYIQPQPYIVESTDYDGSYKTPVLTAGKSFIKGYTNEKIGIYTDLPVIIFDDFTTATKYVNFPFKVKSSAMKILKPASTEVNLKFLFYLMQITHVNFDSHKRYWIGIYSKERFFLPPLNEQDRIVAKIEELFSELDKGIESLKTAQEQLKVYRQSLLKQAFEGKLTEQWRKENADKLESAEELMSRIKREREVQYLKQLKDWEMEVKMWEGSRKGEKKPIKPTQLGDFENIIQTDLPKLPLGWAWFNVSQICDVVRGGSPRPAGDPKFYGGRIPFLKVADLTRNPSIFLNRYTYTIKEAGLNKSRFIKPPKLLISNSGATLGVPKICLIETTFNDGIAAFLSLNEGDLLYHYYFWTSKTSELRNINQGAAQPNLNTKLLESYLIPICSSEEMGEISKALEKSFSVCDRLEEDIIQNLSKLLALRQSILKKAFSGQLVPQDPNDEPASVLLEGIAAEKAKAESLTKKAGPAKKKNTRRKARA